MKKKFALGASLIFVLLALGACKKGAAGVVEELTATIDEKVQKEFNINGKTMSKLVVCTEIKEYDDRGNLIYENNSWEGETWAE